MRLIILNGDSYQGEKEINSPLRDVVDKLFEWGYRVSYENEAEVGLVSIFDNQLRYVLVKEKTT